MIVTIDYETTYSLGDYSLTKLSEVDYILDPRFQTIMCAIKVGANPTELHVGHERIAARFATIDWANTALLSHNCVPGDTEVLTPTGWARLDVLDDATQVAQFDPATSGVSFTVPSAVIRRPYSGPLLVWDSQFHQGAYTPDHRMLYCTPDTAAWRVAPAAEISGKSQNNTYVPTSGRLEGGSLDLSPDEARLLEAIRADGTIRENSVKFNLKKPRKLLRLQDLCSRLNIPLTITPEGRDGVWSVYIPRGAIRDRLIGLLLFGAGRKRLSWQIMGASFEARVAMIDETQHWDGSYRDASIHFSTAVAHDRDVLQAVAACTLTRSRFSTRNNARGFNAVNADAVLHLGSFAQKPRAKLVDGPSTVDFDGTVYCVTVPTGAFIVRRNGVVWVTGNCRFDGAIAAWLYHVKPKLYLDTLSMARALTHVHAGGSSLKKVAKYLGLPDKGDAVVRASGKRLEDFAPDELREYADYCVNDCDLCYEIFQRFTKVFPVSELAVVDACLRMFVEPEVKLDQGKLTQHLAWVREQKALIMAKVAHIDPSVFSSNLKFAALLQNHGVEVPTKLSPATGLETFALAKNDRAFKELCEDPDQSLEVQALLAARLGSKSTIEETRTASLLNLSLRSWGNEQGWFPVPLKYYGAHCVPGNTEVLTPTGWVPLEHWSGGDIAQVRPDKTIEFLHATRFVGPVVNDWISVSARYMQCAFTLGHTMPYLQHGTMRWETMQAAALPMRGSVHVPLAGRLIGSGTITPEQMRVLAMVQADGHWALDTREGRGLFIFVTKPRKIERARSLLAATNICFREGVFPSHPGFVRFSIAWDAIPSWLTPERKFFGVWLLDSTPEAREALMNEVVHWDGWQQGGQTCYSTSDRVNADWLVTVAHLTERCASIGEHKGRGGNQRLNYRVALRQRPSGMVFRKHVAASKQSQRSYCASTQTGFFLARSGGRIFVTGNTGRFSGDGGFNAQNFKRGSPIRDAIVAPEGYRIVHRDASQIEARMVAWLAGCESLLAAFGQGRDVYCEFGTRLYGRKITKADILERFCSKTCILSLGYGAGAERFQHALFIGNGGQSVEIGLDEAKRTVWLYRDTYREIPHLWHIADLMLDRMIDLGGPPSVATLIGHAIGTIKPMPAVKISAEAVWLPNQLAIQYPNLRGEMVRAPDGRVKREIFYDGGAGRGATKLYGAKVCENVSQALSRIVITDVIRRVQHATGYHPFLSTHDSLDYAVPAADAPAMDALLDAEFAIRPSWAVDLPLASEGGFGKSLADAERRVNQ